MSIPKIWFFDMEGTILKKAHHLDNGKVAPSAWTVLAKNLGESCYHEEEATKDRWLAGEYSGYLDWMKDTVLIHKKYGMSQKHLDQIVRNAEFHDGAQELFEWLRSHNVITALVTGGFKALADKVQLHLRIDHALSGCEYFFNDDGFIDFFNLLPADHEGKLSFMNQVLFEHGLTFADAAFIGDGNNDIYLAKKAGLSIAFNAQEQLKEVATLSLDQPRGKENLIEVISLLTRKNLI